jgi:hypothetical protein
VCPAWLMSAAGGRVILIERSEIGGESRRQPAVIVRADSRGPEAALLFVAVLDGRFAGAGAWSVGGGDRGVRSRAELEATQAAVMRQGSGRLRNGAGILRRIGDELNPFTMSRSTGEASAALNALGTGSGDG